MYMSSFDVFDEIYCLSLPRLKDRREYMTKEFKRVNIDPKFIDGIDKDDPIIKDLIEDGHVDMEIHLRNRLPQKENKIYKKEGEQTYILKFAQVAIYLSHMKIFKDIVDNGHRFSLICEDDISFKENYEKILKVALGKRYINKRLNLDSKILLYLHDQYHDTDPFINYNGITHIIPRYRECASCYGITLECAKYFIDNYLPPKHQIFLPIDNLFECLAKAKKINTFQVLPYPVKHLSSKGIFKRTSGGEPVCHTRYLIDSSDTIS
jgi:GR25 family glycosyltransferase involved in LPS biosynthesis